MKKISAVIGSIILLLIFGILISIPVSNDYAAMKTAKRAADIPLPEQTEYVERQADEIIQVIEHGELSF